MNSFFRFALGLIMLVFGVLLALKIFGFIVALTVGIFFHLIIYALAIVGLLAILAGAIYLMVPGGGESEMKAQTKASKKARKNAALSGGDDKPSADDVAAELRRQREELRRVGRE